VRHAYRRWAPVYDFTFGTVAEAGRKHAVKIINRRRGRVLEVGVGTGLSVACYEKHLTVTGIDLSPEMLGKARSRVERQRLNNVTGLHEMDAGALAFPDESFDTVVAMYVMTVVPDAEKVMRELERVCATGGEVILVNHFSQEEGVRGFLERRLAPLATSIGWHAVFTLDRVLVCEDLRLAERRTLWPFGLFTMLRFVKAWLRARAAARILGKVLGMGESAAANEAAAAGAGQGEDQMADRPLARGRPAFA
jgi:phosphatidylethanolamine/phosphatidyl-N-methylethanolamine N-methyltransferase